MLALISQEMPERAQQVGAKTPTLRIRAIERTAGQHAGEKIMGEFPGGVFLAPFAAQESQHRLVIGLAQFTQGGPAFNRFAPGAQDQRPARRGER